MSTPTFDETVLSAGGLEVQFSSPLLHVTLIREKALNALLSETFHGFHHILDVLQQSVSTSIYLLLTGRGRAFSAGGDVRALRSDSLAAGPAGSATRLAAARRILAIEYDLLDRWAALPTAPGPRIVTVALGDGLAFGAGAGLFQACAVRLVSPRFAMAMPEARIGLVPDCGATRFYAGLPGCVGMFLALTGARVVARDALELGLAEGAMAEGWKGEGLPVKDVSEAVVRSCCVAPETLGDAGEIADSESELRRGIDVVFSAGSVEEVMEELRMRTDEDWAVDALKAVEGAAPRAVRETFKVMRMAYAARGEKLREALDRELEVESRLCAARDFEEGVRAALVDKDGKPKWQPLDEEAENRV